MIAEAAEGLRPTLAAALGAAPWIQDIDRAEVDDWLEREAVKGMLLGELTTRMAENNGRLSDKDRWLLERLGAAQNRAQASRDRLLLNPQSRRRAGRDDAGIEDVLAAQREVGARLRAAHGAVLDVSANDPDADETTAQDQAQPGEGRP
jgi:hypothetical protein